LALMMHVACQLIPIGRPFFNESANFTRIHGLFAENW
jgi:hypothetical protein